jgi:uncharacterized membrane protein
MPTWVASLLVGVLLAVLLGTLGSSEALTIVLTMLAWFVVLGAERERAEALIQALGSRLRRR